MKTGGRNTDAGSVGLPESGRRKAGLDFETAPYFWNLCRAMLELVGPLVYNWLGKSEIMREV